MNPKSKESVKRRARRGGIRAIDAGTMYDVPGRLMRISRQIEQGEFGEVTDVVLAVRGVKNGKVEATCYGFGKGSRETHGFLAARLLDRIVD